MKALLFVSLIGSLFLVTGCGGGGGSSPAAVNSPFAGQWAGGWIDQSSLRGSLSLVVGTDGRFSGQVSDPSAGATGTVSGSIRNNGSLQATYDYPATSPVSASGTVSMNAQGHLTGTLTLRQDGETGSALVDLARR